MDASTVGHAWPVSWERAVTLARARGDDPNSLLHEPRLAAHRVLDRLAAAWADVIDSIPGARDAMRAQLDELVDGVPWLTAAVDGSQDGLSYESDCASCGSGSHERRASARHTAVATLIDDAAVATLMGIARALGGEDAATAVHRLAGAAQAAEQQIPVLLTSPDPGRHSDIALLAGADGPTPTHVGADAD